MADAEGGIMRDIKTGTKKKSTMKFELERTGKKFALWSASVRFSNS